ncbi:MAG: hypothetical protein KJO48_15400, partial [Ignavibacteria bacterium]|nr:hypothetical protein [Ignavibacteria bacterium]
MDNKKKIELLKLSAIGCINEDDQATLNSLMLEDENFPWNELGEFQNLAALIPSSLVIETPNWELKDKVARKLYNLRDEIKSQQKQKTTVEQPVETSDQLINESGEAISIEDSGLELTSADDIELPVEEKISNESVVEGEVELPQTNVKHSVDRELIERTTKDYIDSHFEKEIKSTQKNIKKSLLLSLILFVISLLLIVFMFF